MRALLTALLLAAPAAHAASKRPALLPHGRLQGRPAPGELARNLINGTKNVRALDAHMNALDREDPRENREWVTCLRLIAQEGAVLRSGLKQARALIKNEVPLDPGAVDLAFEPGQPLPLPAQNDADGARQALALAAVEEAEPLAAAIILRAQGADELDRISAYEAAADEASLRVSEQRAHLAALAGEKAADEEPAPAGRPAAAPKAAGPALPDIMNAAPSKPRREP
ncbi:MAG: hypothetical protein SF051_11035 [Elusimicrobiota bacterium]|nr:hypothetical protein [Elusimicrobiota bacterium]